MADRMTAPESEAAAEAENNDGWEWAVVEIFGHRRHAGRIREEERFGTKMLRIDVPTPAPAGPEPAPPTPVPTTPVPTTWATHWYGGASVFSLTLADEATVMRLNRSYERPARYLAPPSTDIDYTNLDDPEA